MAIGSSVFATLSIVTNTHRRPADKQTDHATPSVATRRYAIHAIGRRPKKQYRPINLRFTLMYDVTA